jgi:tRNA pseudouridine(55) synthase
MEKTVMIYKNEGETPLECLDRFRVEQPLYKDAVLSYAGRLDPMAEGVMLVLVDEENKNREKYLGLDKTYEVEILFGVKTDTGDILGKVEEVKEIPTEKDVNEVLQSFVGTFVQKYPPYSSKTVDGKPLFQWAREGKLDEIEIPEKTSEIYSIELLDKRFMSAEDILVQVRERISKVKGDFRQEEIVASWESFVSKSAQVSDKSAKMPIIRIQVKCSSGTYMRTLAEKVAEKLDTVGIAWSINRLGYGSL